MAYDPSYDCGASLQALVSAAVHIQSHDQRLFCFRTQNKKYVFAVGVLLLFFGRLLFFLVHFALANFVATF